MITQKPFDPSKPVQTRDGRKARIICTDLKAGLNGDYTIVAIVTNNGRDNVSCYREDGSSLSYSVSGCDLVNIPEKKWVNINFCSDISRTKNGTNLQIGSVSATKDRADRLASANRIACIEIDWPV